VRSVLNLGGRVPVINRAEPKARAPRGAATEQEAIQLDWGAPGVAL
jgi:hypothetical protein